MPDRREEALREFRRRARFRLEGQQRPSPVVTSEDVFEELQIHRAELEIQNEELRDSRVALEISRRSFAELFLLAPVSYLVLDEKGMIQDVNLVGAELLDFARSHLPGKPFTVFLDGPSRRTFSVGLASVVSEGRGFCEELLVRTLKGRTTWVHAEARLLDRGEGGRSVLVAAWDVTSRKEASDELRRQRELLEVTVAARTAELESANVSLRTAVAEHARAEREVRRLNEELEERVARRTAELETALSEMESFSYSVAHDLRAPIRAIDGFASLLSRRAEGVLGSGELRLLGSVKENSVRMGRLIDDLLDFSRTGRMELEATSVEIGPLFEEAFLDVVPEGERGRVRFRVGDLPRGRGDQRLLRRVAQILLDNAFKFSAGRRPPEVEVGCVPGPGETEYFVRDNGVGFDPRFAGKLFGVFQKLHPQEEFAGNGIGLALVRKIVERHGGSVRAEGEVGRGATFSFTLGGETEAGERHEKRYGAARGSGPWKAGAR